MEDRLQTTGHSSDAMRVLQLLPDAKAKGKLTALSLMDEEIQALYARGIQNHSVVHNLYEDASPVLFRHRIPRLRNLLHSGKSVVDCAKYGNLEALAFANPWEKVQIARSLRWIAKVVQKQHISVMHSHWARPNGTAAALVKLRTGVPLVMTLRGADVLEEPEIGYGNTLDPFFTKRIRFALSVADRILGVSTRIVERAIELGADPSKTVVLHKGVDVERFQPGDTTTARASLNLENKPTLLFVGALGPWKGIQDLFHAFLQVAAQVEKVQLVVCGKGEWKSWIESFVQQHGLMRSVRLVGHVDRNTIPTYFQACDVFVLPSLTEGSGNVLLEAAACGKPTVGTRVGGIPDYIDEGQTGWLCEPKNSSDLADKLVHLLSNKEMAKSFGRRGLDRVHAHFRYDQMIDKIVDVYRELAHRRNDFD